MYLKHFGFERHPFRMAPEEDFLYMSRQHSRAFVFMDSAIWSPEGFVVISGEIGSGKTTLLKKMIADVKAEVQLFQIAYTNLQGNDLFQTLLHQAGISLADATKVNIVFALNDHLRQLADKGIPILLAIDEAQNLSYENLEDIRMLAGMESSQGPILRVILLGQPELSDHIAAIPQLSQRVKLFFHLQGLSLDDTERYIQHRLRIAGMDRVELFPHNIIERVHQYSAGIPRLINKISDGLLLCAFAEERTHLIGADLDAIKNELRVSSVATAQPQVALPKPADSIGQTSRSALERIAAALESIDKQLAALSGDEANLDSVRPEITLLKPTRVRGDAKSDR